MNYSLKKYIDYRRQKSSARQETNFFSQGHYPPTI